MSVRLGDRYLLVRESTGNPTLPPGVEISTDLHREVKTSGNEYWKSGTNQVRLSTGESLGSYVEKVLQDGLAFLGQ